MSIIDQVKVDVVSPTHDSDNARQLGAVSRCFARHRSATPSWHDPSMQAPEMHTPQLTRKEAALVASGSMTNQLAVRIRWSCTAYRRTTHPFGAVKKNLACANTGLGAVTEWRDIVKIARHGTDSIMLNPVNVCIEHHVSQRLSAQHHPSTRCGKLCHLSIGHIWQWPILHLDQLPILQLDQLPILQLDQSPISYWAISHSTIDRIGCLEK
ncbi:hypothetical protein EDC04DRAFT_2618509 [Pisolithus marmoratus]|nr:hypothetical protein EDC04DRAFT_2618509 [Pisolithus marmoratus]